jgi:hypothetical protein
VDQRVQVAEKPSKISCEKCGSEEVGIIWPVSHSYNVRGVDSYGFVQIDYSFHDEDWHEMEESVGFEKVKLGKRPDIVCLGGCGEHYPAPEWMRFRVMSERSEDTTRPL